MTYSLAARDPETGAFGMVITTSAFAVGSRCCYAKTGIGAVLTQHRTDPRLGPRGIELLDKGYSADETIEALVASSSTIHWRQLAVVDSRGATAAYHGSAIYSIYNDSHGEGCVAIGNIIANPDVTVATVDGYQGSTKPRFSERLLDGLAAGLVAGGEMKDVKSAALYIVTDQAFPYMDLRVDMADEPIARLIEIENAYAKEADFFPRKVLSPDRISADPELVKLTENIRPNK